MHTGFCARFFAPSLSSKTEMHDVPNPGKIKFHTYRENTVSLMVSASATYSASVVESVRHLFKGSRKPANTFARTHL